VASSQDSKQEVPEEKEKVLLLELTCSVFGSIIFVPAVMSPDILQNQLTFVSSLITH
jgi:hypothetical protein